MSFAVWVVTFGKGEKPHRQSPWGRVAAVIPIEHDKFAQQVAKVIDGSVHPGSVDEGVSFNAEVTVP